MKHVRFISLLVTVGLAVITLFFVIIRNGNMQLLNPQGYIAHGQSVLLLTAIFVALLIGLPVVGFSIFIVFRYRDTNTTREFTPDWKAPNFIAASWWIAPAILVLFWAILGYQAAHAYDPFKAIGTNVKPLDIEVVSLQWKWLFIYPNERIASVNYLAFPANTPLHFHLTSDAPMNSFWIPSLGSQIYAMTGMTTQLNLIANHTGIFPGGSAEMSGAGFAGMQFNAESMTTTKYTQWVQKIQKSQNTLDLATYNELAKPSSYVSPMQYKLADDSLFDEIIMKYMPKENRSYMTHMGL